jgi:energy-coupling factor transporter ATP-binding protein EcfA2
MTAFGMRCRSEADFRKVRSKAAYLFQDPDDQLFRSQLFSPCAPKFCCSMNRPMRSNETQTARMFDILSRQSIAMIFVSHDWSLLERLTDRVVVLRNGRFNPAMLPRHPLRTDHVHLHCPDVGEGSTNA